MTCTCMTYFTPKLKPPHSSEFKVQDPLFWLHDLPSILSGSRPRITTSFDTFNHQLPSPSSPLETFHPESPPEIPCAQTHEPVVIRQRLPAECNPAANSSSNKRPRARGSTDEVQKSNEALLVESNFRIIDCANGDVDGIVAQLKLSGISRIAVTVIDDSFSSPFNIFGRATAEFDRLVGFIACLEKEHVSEFVAFIMPPNSCLEFIYKLLGSELSVCMWNVMEVLRQCEKQTQYKHNIDWSLRHCICLSAAVWLVDPSADCTDFESCISFIKSSTQIQPPTVPSETIAVPSDSQTRYIHAAVGF